MASNVPLQFVWCCECPFTPFLRTLKSIKKALISWRNPTGWPFVMMCNMAWTFVQVKSYEAVADLGTTQPRLHCVYVQHDEAHRVGKKWRLPSRSSHCLDECNPPLHLSPRGVTWANTWFAEYVPLVQFSFVLGSVRHFFPLPLPLGFVCFSPLMFSVWRMPVPFLSRGG